MKICPTKIIKLIVPIIVLFLTFSCNKDSDLLADYIVGENGGLAENVIDLENGTIITSEDKLIAINILRDSRFSAKRKSAIVKKVSQPANGSTEIQTDSVIVYIPNEDFNGKDTISYTVEETTPDNIPVKKENTVVIEVSPVLDAIHDTVQIPSDKKVTVDVLKNDTFTNKDKVTVSKTTTPSKGKVVVNKDNTLTYTPTTNASGDDTFTYTAQVVNADKTTSTDVGKVTVVITSPAPDSDPNQVNFSKYGAVGDGKTDDTKALQAALNAEGNLVGTPGAVYKITETLDIDKPGDQHIDWNNATMLIGTELEKCININKSNGITYLTNLKVDANLKGEWIMQMNSSFEFNNVHIKNVYSNDQSAIAMYIRITKSGNWSTLKMNNCTVDNVIADGNGVIGDNKGAARAILYDYISTPKNLHAVIENSDFRNVFAEDGDVLQYRSNDQNWNSGSTVTFNNCKFEIATRRIGKIFAGDIHFNNCTFTNISKSHPKFKYAIETGGFLSLSNTAGMDPARRISFDSCIFNGSDFDNRIIQNKSTDISISNSVWNNVDFRMWQYGGGVCIRNNIFSAGTKIYTAVLNSWWGPMVVEGNKNASGLSKEYLKNNPPVLSSDHNCQN